MFDGVGEFIESLCFLFVEVDVAVEEESQFWLHV